MDTPTSKSTSWLERMRSHRLTTTFALLATFSAGILVGSVITRGVSGKEQAPDTSDAKPLVIPAAATLSNGFSQIAKQIGPAVVNINTESLPKQSADPPWPPRHAAWPVPDSGGDDDSRATCRTSSTASSVAPVAVTTTATAAMGGGAPRPRLGLHRRSARLHHHQQPRRRQGRQDLRPPLHRS